VLIVCAQIQPAATGYQLLTYNFWWGNDSCPQQPIKAGLTLANRAWSERHTVERSQRLDAESCETFWQSHDTEIDNRLADLVILHKI
jgi:hypothetical protein